VHNVVLDAVGITRTLSRRPRSRRHISQSDRGPQLGVLQSQLLELPFDGLHFCSDFALLRIKLLKLGIVVDHVPSEFGMVLVDFTFQIGDARQNRIPLRVKQRGDPRSSRRLRRAALLPIRTRSITVGTNAFSQVSGGSGNNRPIMIASTRSSGSSSPRVNS
jgi:hypothetical protein